MTASTAVTTPDASVAPPADCAPEVSRTAPIIAGALWVFVSGLLVYGIAQTAIKAAALFG